MPTPAEIMDRSASLLNDTAQSLFTYTRQIPYLNTALDELQELLEENNAETTNKVSVVTPVNVGTTTIAMPTDAIEIQALYERLQGTTNDFILMVRREFLPETQVLTAELIWWTLQGQAINFIGANTNRDVKIEYTASLFVPVTVGTTTSTTAITTINSKNFLSYRTAALCAQFIGENKERSDDLNLMAQMALDRLLNVNVKGRQAIATRRKPFMAGYKYRSWI